MLVINESEEGGRGEGGQRRRKTISRHTHIVGQRWGDASPPPLPFNVSSLGHCSCIQLRSWGREAEEREG